MNRNNRLAQILMLAVLGTVALAGCKKKEAPVVTPPPAAEPMPPAPAVTATPSVTSVDLGNAVGADMRVATPMTTFKAKDTIHASVATATSDAMATVPGKLGVKWIHVDSGQVVHEESKDVNFTGNGVTDFQISKPDGWPTGKYRVEVSLDGAVVQSREFEVR
jgi:multidrug efflux pump subunit AcrA (membrane-fusion protein)